MYCSVNCQITTCSHKISHLWIVRIKNENKVQILTNKVRWSRIEISPIQSLNIQIHFVDVVSIDIIQILIFILFLGERNPVKNLANFKLNQFTFRNFWKSLAWAILFFLTYIWGRCGGRSGTPAGMSASSMIKFPSLITRTIKRRTGSLNFF